MKKLLFAKVNGKLLRFNLKQNKSILVVYSVLLFACFPLTVIVRWLKDGANLSYLLILESVPYLLIFTTLVLILLTPFVVFNYLTSKKAVDVYHALPIRRNELFATLNITSVLLVLIPFILNYLLGFVLADFLGYTTSNAAYPRLLYIIVMFFIIHSIPVFVIVNTGTVIDSLIHTGILTFLPFAVFLTINYLIDVYSFSLKYLDDWVMNLISPIYALFNMLLRQNGFRSCLITTFYWIIIYLIFTIITLRIFSNRRSEKAEEPFINNWYFPLIAGTFTGLMFLILNITFKSSPGLGVRDFFKLDTILISLSLTFVGYTILNFFRYRSVKTLLRSIKQYLIIVGVTSLIAVSMIVTEFFGLSWRVPDIKNIECIELNIGSMLRINPVFGQPALNGIYFNNWASLTSDESIEEFVYFHKLVNRRVKASTTFLMNKQDKNLTDVELPYHYLSNVEIYDYKNYTASDITLPFTYILKSGRKVSREITLPLEMLFELNTIVDNPDYQKIVNPILLKTSNVSSKSIHLYDNAFTKEYMNLPSTFKSNLKETYLKDLELNTSDDLVYNPSKLKYIISYSLVSGTETEESLEEGIDWKEWNDNYLFEPKQYFMFIDDRFPNTISYLDSLKETPKDIPAKYAIHSTTDPIIPADFGTISWSDNITTDNSTLDQTLLDSIEGNHIRNDRRRSLLVQYQGYQFALPLEH